MYRKCVVIVVFNPENNLCLVCERSDIKGQWQFPQGGVDFNESLENAAYRELFEETGIKKDKIEQISSTGSYKYDYPKNVKRKELGQEQTWFLFHKISDLNIVLSYEFVNFKWVKPSLVLNDIVDFKKQVYLHALKDFGLI